MYIQKAKKSYDSIKVRKRSALKLSSFPRGKSEEGKYQNELQTSNPFPVNYAPSSSLIQYQCQQMVINEAESKDEHDDHSQVKIFI